MPKLENCVKVPGRGWVNLLLVFVILLAIFVAGLFIQTFTVFKQKAETLLSEQQVQQDRLDGMLEELTRISEEVEAWPGVTEITDEIIPSLADPEVKP